jgi:hypothetical protein
MPPRVRVYLLRVQEQVPGARQQFLAQRRARVTSPISVSADTSQNEQIVNVPSSPLKPSSVSSTW